MHSWHFSFTLFHTFVILYYLSTSCGILMIWPASRKEWRPLKNIQDRLVLHILYHVLGLKYYLSFFKPLSVIGPIFKHVLNIWCVCSIIHIKDHSVSVQEKLVSELLLLMESWHLPCLPISSSEPPNDKSWSWFVMSIVDMWLAVHYKQLFGVETPPGPHHFSRPLSG